MTRGWWLVLLVGAATMLVKAAGPALLCDRELPSRFVPVIALLPPALFGALIAVQTLASDHRVIVDARLGGLAAAIIGAHVRAPAVVVLAGAAAVTAALRVLFR